MKWQRAADSPPETESSPGFVEIDLVPRRAPAVAGGTLVELDFGSGLVLRIRPLHSQPASLPLSLPCSSKGHR